MDQYDEFFKGQLSQLGEYDGVFFPKSRARTMREEDRRTVDGCATFFKTNKYLTFFSFFSLSLPLFLYTLIFNLTFVIICTLL